MQWDQILEINCYFLMCTLSFDAILNNCFRYIILWYTIEFYVAYY